MNDPTDYNYLDDENAACLPHVHDYWGDQTAIRVAEKDFTLRQQGTGQIGVPFRLDDGTTVFPGTAWLNATATWTSSDPLPKKIGLSFRAANGVVKDLTLTSGVAASSEVNESMADPPHTTVSLWEFTVWMEGAATANVHLRLDISRQAGAIPPAPPHPSYWNGNTSIPIFDQAGPLYDAMGIGGQVRPGQQIPQDLPSAKIHVVPTDTKTLQIGLFYNSSTPPTTHYDPVLNWRGADKGLGGETATRPAVVQKQSVNGLFQWSLEVAPRQWDSPYAKRTYWAFSFTWSSPANPATFMDGNYPLVLSADRDPTIQDRQCKDSLAGSLLFS
ncbi:MAG: hypothetical protein HYT80_05005 [Euryarchaeota archaeon]|nr:hypothetical protein [Euryarchaeota archaeon]